MTAAAGIESDRRDKWKNRVQAAKSIALRHVRKQLPDEAITRSTRVEILHTRQNSSGCCPPCPNVKFAYGPGMARRQFSTSLKQQSLLQFSGPVRGIAFL